MEYSLLKQITPQLPYLEPHFYARLTSVPSKDFVNPGVGQVIKLYEFYVPLAATNNPYKISKIDLNQKINQEGFGGDQVEPKDNEVKASEVSLQSNNSNLDNNIENGVVTPTTSNGVGTPTTSSAIKLSEGIVESFQHPKIKVGKIVIDKDPYKIKSKMSKSLKKHKFNVI